MLSLNFYYGLSRAKMKRQRSGDYPQIQDYLFLLIFYTDTQRFTQVKSDFWDLMFLGNVLHQVRMLKAT